MHLSAPPAAGRAGARPAPSIRQEIAVAALAVHAAAGTTSVHPLDYGHRVPS